MGNNIPKDKDLSEHAQRQLQKLAETGLSNPFDHTQAAGNPPVQTRLVGGRIGWLRLGADEQEFGYRGAEVFKDPSFTDQAIRAHSSAISSSSGAGCLLDGRKRHRDAL